jgi:hypothetical protein
LHRSHQTTEWPEDKKMMSKLLVTEPTLLDAAEVQSTAGEDNSLACWLGMCDQEEKVSLLAFLRLEERSSC